MARNDKKQNRQPVETELEPNVTYEEIGRVHRYFLNWRNALFAGHITVIYAHVVGYSWLIDRENTKPYELLLLISALVMTIIFWLLEYRIRGLYTACLDAGEAWEQRNGVIGVYERLKSINSKATHSKVLNGYFSLVILVIGIFIFLVSVSKP